MKIVGTQVIMVNLLMPKHKFEALANILYAIDDEAAQKCLIDVPVLCELRSDLGDIAEELDEKDDDQC